MRQIKEIMRLRYELKLSQDDIAASVRLARSTVRDYLLRARAAGLQWPLPEDISNEKLNDLLFPPDANKGKSCRPIPDWNDVHKELKRKSVTLQLLWEEYKQNNPDGYQYSWYASRYRAWAKTKDVWMPQNHKAGEKTFVDFSGLTIPIWSTNFQEIRFNAEIFVAVLGASDLIFCVAKKSQKLQDWIDANQEMFSYYGGATELIVPDNLRSAVTKPDRYEPTSNYTYEEMSRHYDCAIMPTRSNRPRDKAKVEKAVQLVQQRILAKIRNEKLTSLDALNEIIAKLLDDLNHRQSKSFGCSRFEMFQEVEKHALKPLPESLYELATWQTQQVNGGYHVKILNHHYSVPYEFVRKKVDIRITKNSIEIFYNDERIACHRRNSTSKAYTTVEAHRPESHRQQSQWHSENLQSWAQGIGPNTYAIIQGIFLDDKKHLYQKERSALGVLRLSNAFSDNRLELACKKALVIGTHRIDSIKSLIKRDDLSQADNTEEVSFQTPDHENIRGPDYFH